MCTNQRTSPFKTMAASEKMSLNLKGSDNLNLFCMRIFIQKVSIYLTAFNFDLAANKYLTTRPQ